MQWLIAHMWTALAATGVLGLLLGWAVRGLRLRSKLRKAEGERNIAQGVLAEKETELEALYAAGREPVGDGETAVPVASNDQELRGALAEREERLQALSDELARSKAELNDLRGQAAKTDEQDISATTVGTAVAGIAAGAALADDNGGQRLDANIDKEEATLEWRNRYLESRVRSLEEKIKEISNGEEIPGDTAAIAVPMTAADSQEAEGTVDDGDIDKIKLKWQADYLKQRLNYFEKYGPPTLAGAAGLVAAIPSEVKTAASEEGASASTSDEEIASLRWRNRYLEGRLAYYEGDKAVADEGDSGIAALAENTAAMPASTVSGSKDTEPVAALAADDETLSDLIDVDAEDAEPTPKAEDPSSEQDASSHDVALVERGVKPMALEGPVDGEGDDLTAIGGIGPKIQEVLNGFGVFHYDQIAAWTPENVEWVDDHLAFEGRIEREQWVQQAEALSNVS